MARLRALSKILGWAESIWKFFAIPKPTLVTRTPRGKGSMGSRVLVRGSSANTSKGRRYSKRKEGWGLTVMKSSKVVRVWGVVPDMAVREALME